jgi:hypothetical protein
MNAKIFIWTVIILVLLIGGWWLLKSSPVTAPINSPSPTFSVTVTPTATPTPSTPNITITSPKNGETVDSPILVTGRARIFENQFTVQVKNSSGHIFATAHVFTDAKDSGQFGNYNVRIPLPVGSDKDLKVEALAYSAKGDGSFEGYASVPVHLKYTDSMNVYAGFNTDSNDCTQVTLFPRQILKTTQFPYMSLVELLKGTGVPEVNQGAKTAIPEGVQIQLFKQSGSTISVDFNQALQQGVAGSCRVQEIRSQITKTLKQFLGVDTVIISINGKTDNILQP